MDGEAKLVAYQEAKKAVLAAAKEIVKGRLDAFWAQAPENLVAVKWRQYTPYFNDGEPCVFSVHGCDFKFSPLPEELAAHVEDDDEDGDWIDSWSVGYYSKDKLKIDAPDFPDDELMLAAFEDHVEITCERDGTIHVDEYSHD